MNETELAELSESIKANGLRNPIILFEGKILDGRNRYRACQAVGIKPRFEQYEGNDPLQFAVDANENRRHDNLNERAMAGARLATLKNGTNRFTKVASTMMEATKSPNTNLTIHEAAELVGVSHGSISRAKEILASGNTEVIEKVESGELSLRAGVRAITQEESEEIPKTKSFVVDGKVVRKDAPVSLAMNQAKAANNIILNIPKNDPMWKSAMEHVFNCLTHLCPSLKNHK